MIDNKNSAFPSSIDIPPMSLAQVAWKLGDLARRGAAMYTEADLQLVFSQLADAVRNNMVGQTAKVVDVETMNALASKWEFATDISFVRQCARELRSVVALHAHPRATGADDSSIEKPANLASTDARGDGDNETPVSFFDDLVAMLDIPEKNCSCHISPPCTDCVDNDGLRQAVEDTRWHLRRDMADAERYRWLMKHATIEATIGAVMMRSVMMRSMPAAMRKDVMDRAIDAVIDAEVAGDREGA